MNADNELLASAYLDGELTVDERRIAEADPAVMAEVEQLRALRSELAEVEPPTDGARERAMTAAIGAFREIHPAPSAVPPAARVVEISRRRDPARWLGVAAAVLVIGLLGVVLATGLRGGDDDDSADEPAGELAVAVPTEEPADDSGADEPFAADGSDAVDRVLESTTIDAEAEIAAAEESAEAPAAEPAEEPAEGDSDEADEAADDMGDVTRPGSTTAPAAIALLDAEEYLDGHPITYREELTWVARHLLDLVDLGELPPTPNHSCPFPDVLARAVLIDDDTPVDIYIAVTPDTRTVLAIDQEHCRVLLRTSLEP